MTFKNDAIQDRDLYFEWLKSLSWISKEERLCEFLERSFEFYTPVYEFVDDQDDTQLERLLKVLAIFVDDPSQDKEWVDYINSNDLYLPEINPSLSLDNRKDL